MRYGIYSVFDTAAQAFAQPFYAPQEQVAVRGCKDMVNDPEKNSQPAKHPEDFEVYELGSFEDSSGSITVNSDGPRLVARFKDLVQASN